MASRKLGVRVPRKPTIDRKVDTADPRCIPPKTPSSSPPETPIVMAEAIRMKLLK